MKPQVVDMLKVLENLAPAHLAEEWDNVGLLIGSRLNRVSKILIGLDATNMLVDEAINCGADTIITHHPVIFKPLPSIHTDEPAGKLLQKALSNNINIIGCHTNLDSAEDGVNDVLAHALGLDDLSPLAPAGDNEKCGLGRIGCYREPLDKSEFIARLFKLLKLDSIQLAGILPEQIARVALCGGSGSDFAPLARSKGADVYLSAEIKHATAVWAKETGFAVIDGTHYATEKPSTFQLASKLQSAADENGWDIQIQLTETEEHPFVSLHTENFRKKK